LDEGENTLKDFVELRHYITLVLKRWWILVITIFLSIVAGYSYVRLQPRMYEATASILVGQSIRSVNLSTSDFRTSEELAQTYAALARREPVLKGVVESLGLDMRWQALRGRVSASLVTGTQLVEISVQMDSPAEAVSIANEVANQLILLSPTALQNQDINETIEFVNRRLENLQGKIENGQGRLEELEAIDVSEMGAGEVTALQSEINSLNELLVTWELNYAQLLNFTDNRRSANYLALVESAQARSAPVSPDTEVIMLVATVLGLVAGLGLAFLLEHFDDTIRSTADLGQFAGLRPLGIIREKKKGHQDTLVTAEARFTPDSEAYRMIRSNIQFASADRSRKSVLVTSAAQGEGKSTAVSNLGVVMAQAGLRTIVVDTDLRQPVLAKIFGLPEQSGLTESLQDPALKVTDLLVNTSIPDLQLLSSGAPPPNPSELLGSQRMREIMRELVDAADIVIYDSPPAALVPDAAILSKRVDGVILLIQAGKTRRDIVRQGIFNLQQAKANLYGVVLNRISSKQQPYPYKDYYSDQFNNGYNGNGYGGSGQKRWWKSIPFLNLE
jgi:non-specific protein-tyrosine kinase